MSLLSDPSWCDDDGETRVGRYVRDAVVRRWIAVSPPKTLNVLGGSIQKHRHLGYRSKAVGRMEQDHWLVPVEDRRVREPESREGMLETFSLGSYLMLVEYTGRLVRNGKARMNATVKDVFTRLETNAEMWQHRLGRMLASSSNLRGTFFATGANTIRVIGEQRKRRIMNLSPQVAS